MATTTLPYTPPLQDLPAWLSYSTFLTTVGETAVVTQAVVNLPLTYYGPPIPLGTDGVWVYGGLTSPPPTPTATSSSSASAPTTPPASVTASPSTPFSNTVSSTAPATPTASPSHRKEKLPVWAILVIALVGGFAVGVSALMLYAICYRRRHPGSSSSSSDRGDDVAHRGARFRIIDALTSLPRSLHSSHRHSRVPQHDEEDAMVIHPNDSDWHIVGPSQERLAAIRNVRPPPVDRTGVAYGPILPFEGGGSHRASRADTPPPSQPSSAGSSQPGTATLPRPDTMGGNSFSDMSNHSLFFNPALQAGESFDRDRRVFPSHYSLGIEQQPQLQPLNPPPRPRALPPVDQDLVLPPPLIGGARRSGEGRRSGERARSQAPAAAPMMAYPDSPVSDADEAAALLALRRRSASPPARTSTPPVNDNNRLISRLSTLIKRLSGSSQAATTTPFMLHPSTPDAAGPSTTASQQMKETGAGLGFGFLAAPPASMSTRRTGTTAADRPVSTISGATVYHDAHSRPHSPYYDAPPTYQRVTPDADADPGEADILDEQPPRPLRYPPGLTPPQAAYQQRRGSGGVGVGETGMLEELEEEDIVGELPPRPLDDLDLEDDAPEAGEEFAALASGAKGKEREKRGTLGAPMPFPASKTPSGSHKSPTSSHFPHRSASRSTGGHSGSGSGTSSSRRSRRTGDSVSSSSLRRLQQSSGSGDAYLVPRDEMPLQGVPKGKRRGGPLLSATFGPPATWLRSRSPSAGSAPPTPRSGRSSKSHGKSKSRSGSQPHSQEPSRGPTPPPPAELRTVASFAESAFSMQQSMTTAVTTEPSASVRYVPSRQPIVHRGSDDKAELPVDEEERLPLTSA